MKINTRFLQRLCFLSLAFALLVVGNVSAQNRQRVVLQGFWWDFKNNNYPQGWGNYLAELAPRLRELGINAVWVPVNQKNANPNSVGYVPFDHYDLGDKYQKNNLKTPFGDKDEYLRMVAILHANGIEVIQDIVFNHMNDGGSANGAGGQDPAAVTFYNNNRFNQTPNLPEDPTGGFKNYRYACYETPATTETAENYLARKGRWPKNWQNFYPTPADARFTGDDLSRISFGADIAFRGDAIGTSSNATHNPTQTNAYMRNEARAWMTWMKKQTGIDGYRLDAVKHFPAEVCEDMMWNMRFNAGFASGADSMFAVGELVGSKNEIDGWTDAVQNRAGTFDFGYRGFQTGETGLVSMVYGQGGYDIGNLPAMQQDRRLRTAPFVNNHDTFRPTQPGAGSPSLQANGNYPVNAQGAATGWWSNDELARNIDPREPRLAAAYAAIMAIDGTPVIFFEDLFDVGTTGKRYTHRPSNATDLPVRQDIATIIRCHQKLNFKKGSYKVRLQSGDHLIIERSARAVIGITDSWATTQTSWIDTDFAPGTVLKDYAGSTTETRTVQGDKRVNITTPPCNGNSARRGFSVWAPVGISYDAAFTTAALATVQEWELADDLGDKNIRSLQQGGRLPAGSMQIRTGGKIFVEAGKVVNYQLFCESSTIPATALITNQCGAVIDSVTGTGTITKNYTPTVTGWLVLRARNANTSAPARKAWLKASYTAPREVVTSDFPSVVPPAVDMGPARAVCASSNLVNATVGSGFTYQWQDMNGNVLSNVGLFQIPAAGSYVVVKTSTVTGCSARDTLVVTDFVQAPQASISQSNDTLYVTQVPNATYQWLLNNVVIQGATNYFFKPTQNGSYSVRITLAPLGCVSTTTGFVTSVKESLNLESQVSLFPNPSKGQFTAEVPNMNIEAIEVHTVQGKRLWQQTVSQEDAHKTSLDISGLPSGMYLVRFRLDGKWTVKKVVVQK